MNDACQAGDFSFWNDLEFVCDISSGRFDRAEQAQVTLEPSHVLEKILRKPSVRHLLALVIRHGSNARPRCSTTSIVA